MITLRRNSERRHVQSSKHDTWHSFYPQDHPDLLAHGFGVLSIFNEIRLRPGDGTVLQQGDETEIVDYVYVGALAHEDSTGNVGVIRAGEFQRLATARGSCHKETNASQTIWAHVFRIALCDSELELDCAHEQKRFTAAQRRNVLCVVASPDRRNGSLRIHPDALIYSTILESGHHLVHELEPGRSAWLHILYGEAILNEFVLTQGDGVGITNELSVSLTVQEDTEMLLVDLGAARHVPEG